MKYSSDVLIFTDMDGSLLCHTTYSHKAADDLLEQLEHNGIPVIPTTSKTKSELLHLRTSLNNCHPFIIENGAAVLIPIGYFEQQPFDTEVIGDFWVKKFVHTRHYWQSLITHISSVDAHKFTTFSELTTRQISALTGLGDDDARRASRRLFGEPVVWYGNDNEKEKFTDELKKMGANVLQGGRFIHVSGECDKGLAMRWLVDQYEKYTHKQSSVTIAIGDSQNDSAMLEIADIALVIKSPTHEPPTLQRKTNIYLSEKIGPEGWAQGVETLFETHIPPLPALLT